MLLRDLVAVSPLAYKAQKWRTSGFQGAVCAMSRVDLRGYRAKLVVRRRVRGSLERHAASLAWNVFLSAVFFSL
jgi:hypothetical protein